MGADSSKPKSPLFVKIDQDDDYNFDEEAVTTEVSLQIPPILQKIIHQLEFPDLLTCRLVNHRWSQISTDILRNPSSSSITIVHDIQLTFRQSETHHHKRSIYHFSSPASENRKLKALLRLSTPRFPCTNFKFIDGPLGSLDPQNFFQTQGVYIKCLNLISQSEKVTSKNIFERLLTTQLPRVEELTIQNCIYKWDDNDRSTLFMPSLKRITCIDSTVNRDSADTILVILHAAPFLKNAKIFGNDYVKIESKDSDDVQTMMDSPFKSTDEELVLITNFWKAGLRLKVLRSLKLRRNFDDYDERSRKLKMVMDFWSESVEKIILDENSWSNNMSFPKLNKLKKISLSSIEDFGFLAKCPNLICLDCTRLGLSDDGVSDKKFEIATTNGIVLEFVEEIKIGVNCSKTWLQKRLCQLCPNFRILDLMYSQNIPELLTLIFESGRQLQELKIRIAGSRLKFINLDSVLTGISEEDCSALRCRIKEGKEMTGKKIERRRRGPSIHDLKGLKYLKFIFGPGSDHELHLQRRMSDMYDSPLSPILTPVSLYAFKSIPKLKIMMEFDFHCQYVNDIKWSIESVLSEVNLRDRRLL